MKTNFFALKTLMVLGCCVWFFSCEKENPSDENPVVIQTLTSIDVFTTLDSSKVYIVEEAVQIDAQLIIPPGTVIKFKEDCRLDINYGGSVIAIGTVEKPIVFTSIKDDLWKGDTNKDKGSSSPSSKDWGCIIAAGDASTFHNCKFLYGGGFGDHTSTLEVKSMITITNCTFGYNYGGLLNDNTNGALCLLSANLASIVSLNEFYGNDIPVVIDVNMSFDATNTFNHPDNPEITNKYNGIFVNGYTVENIVDWNEYDVPFIATGHIGVTSDAILTLATNAALKMYSDTRIDMHGTGILNIDGAIVTSFKDDECKGDANGDGTNSLPNVGDWVGINLGYGNYRTGANIKYALH
ncbi:MAG: hypothetical protein K9H49_18930 [Bacteroidales bacterium]|nr:hypothetical protein [Bacteroidales bacterium]MCF8390949.1 hypothetical protein [Bacteroidales bacterium]